MQNLRKCEDNSGFFQFAAQPRFVPGDKIRIINGMFSACLGLFEGMADKDRITILLDMLGRHVRVIVDGRLAKVVRVDSQRLYHLLSRPSPGEHDLRLDALRGALHLDDSEDGEGLFCWRGLLYYKWVLQETLPILQDLMGDLGTIRLIGPRPPPLVEHIQELKNQVANGFALRTGQAGETIAEYDEAFALLRDQTDPAAFSRFLVNAPGVFRALGEDIGLLAHAATYWRFRFPADEPLLATPDDLIDILEEFTLALS